MDERSRFRVNFSSRRGQPPGGAKQISTAGRKKVKLPNARWWAGLVIAVLVFAISALAYGYLHTRNQLNAAKQSQTVGGTEAERIISQVSKSVQLPSGETPTLATVQDAGKLKDQVFFKDAQNGDKVLYYAKSGQAVLYRPSSQKVILFAYVNLSENSSNSQQ